MATFTLFRQHIPRANFILIEPDSNVIELTTNTSLLRSSGWLYRAADETLRWHLVGEDVVHPHKPSHIALLVDIPKDAAIRVLLLNDPTPIEPNDPLDSLHRLSAMSDGNHSTLCHLLPQYALDLQSSLEVNRGRCL